jgi:hypothetical protein
MLRHTLIAIAAVFVVIACNSVPVQTAENTVGGANVVSSAQAPMATATTSLTLDWGPKGQAGQVAIADVISYGGKKPTITAPAGWQMIRDDSTPTTRQSLYWHAIQGNDSSTATWTFSDPVDVQGAILLLDNVAAAAPVDVSSGNSDNSGTLNAKSVVTTGDGDLILTFWATDYSHPNLNPVMPENTKTLINLETPSNQYWVLATYQSQSGPTEDKTTGEGQLFRWVAAQVAIKNGSR